MVKMMKFKKSKTNVFLGHSLFTIVELFGVFVFSHDNISPIKSSQFYLFTSSELFDYISIPRAILSFISWNWTLFLLWCNYSHELRFHGSGIRSFNPDGSLMISKRYLKQNPDLRHGMMLMMLKLLWHNYYKWSSPWVCSISL